MATKLYLHIGHPKCGSSTLQQALYENRQALLKAGIGVVDGKLELMKASTKMSFPIGFFRKLLADLPEVDPTSETPAAAMEALEDQFRALKRKADGLGLKAVVLSAENLARPAGVAMLAAAKPHFDCEIIYYIRRHDDWLISSWLQWQFKTGISLDDFIDQALSSKRRFLFRRVVEAAVTHFGEDKLRIRVLFPSNLEGGDLVTDFWSALGVPAKEMAAVKSRNVSFSVDLVSVLKESPYLYDDAHDNNLTGFIDEHHAYPRKPKRRDPLGHYVRRDIINHYLPEINWLKNNFLDSSTLAGWLQIRVPKDEGQKPKTITLEGVAEMLNLNMVMLKELRDEVEKIKRAVGIRE
ncbi:hypothetical protein [Kordiimonas marina]|uniref:hypothetical protein n=1 Tax=Kordiimonas marina TaxID=2872312 RepID=UPI001FF35B0D|nr:hypothetical protein [Kordiimonas marina]MCJ9430768.1 hypothetical protein [Kordiimonas marina]